MTLEQWWKIAKRTKRVYYLTEHISRTGMGGAYSLFVVHKGQLERAWPNESGGGYSETLAKKLGFRLSKKWRAWYREGCGYDRAHDVLYSIARQYELDGLKASGILSTLEIEEV